MLCQHSVSHTGALSQRSSSTAHISNRIQRLPLFVARDNARRTACHASQFENVKDVMSSGRMFTVSPEDTVDQALELLVTNRITGLPVVDKDGKVVGVVSDFDLLALDTIGRTNLNENLFPSADQTWKAFKEVKALLAKSAGVRIGDVMTANPIMVSPDTCLNEAAQLLLTKKIRRLPVVDQDGKLVGLLSRGNIIKAALEARKSL